ncbi:MAG: aminoacyl-histidine dipeptidase [bacterium]
MAVDHQKTKEVLHWFEELSKIPRCSKNEAQICEWLTKWAGDNGFEVRRDRIQNVVIEVPGTAGYENSPGVVIQGHMDMVCEKAKGVDFDFSKDPIKLVYDGDWLTADQTTLGADNGIAIAMALTVALDKDSPHPPLELLFTVDEETGLTGATELESGFIKGKFLLNVDSEDEGVFTVGCAGGKDTHLAVPVAEEALPGGSKGFKLVAGGMSGGHSGVDIHEQRANAIHVLTRALNELLKELDVRIVALSGGTAHNAIPRDAEAVVALPADKAGRAGALVGELAAALRQEHGKTDPNITLILEPAAASGTGLSAAGTRHAVDFLMAMPHGVADMSLDIQGLVQTSNNLATLKLEGGKVITLTSQRSSVMNRLDWLTSRIEGAGRAAGGVAETGGGYPAWQPNMDSPLLAKCVAVYKELFNKEPVVEIIHAGLECGIIGAKYEGMDMISFGPTIKNPHSPDEKLLVSTIGQVYDFMAALMKALK